MTQPDWRTIPAPLFLITPSLQLLDFNAAARHVFELSAVRSLQDLLDAGSLAKAERMLQRHASSPRIELNMRSREKTISLFDVYVSWQDDSQGWLLCQPKQDEVTRVASMITLLANPAEEDRSGSPLPVRPAAPPASFTRQRRSDRQACLQTAAELLELLRSDLVELRKEDFLEAILHQLDAAAGHSPD